MTVASSSGFAPFFAARSPGRTPVLNTRAVRPSGPAKKPTLASTGRSDGASDRSARYSATYFSFSDFRSKGLRS